MKEFILEKCCNEKSDMLAEAQEVLAMKPADIYNSPQKIADLAIIVKEKRNQQFCMLPFCHTLEAEILGGNINLGDDTAGARAGAPILDTCFDVPKIVIQDKNRWRHDNMLSAIQILKERGEETMYCITGPIGTLTNIVESRVVFKEWRKFPEDFSFVLDFLQDLLIGVAIEAADRGACAIEYADPPSAVSIVGPKFASEMAERFTMNFINTLSVKLGKEVPVYLCPLSATKDMRTLENATVYAKCPKAMKQLCV